MRGNVTRENRVTMSSGENKQYIVKRVNYSTEQKIRKAESSDAIEKEAEEWL